MKRTILIAAAVCCAAASAARADVVWRGDYSTGNLSQWSELQGLASRITVQQSVVRPGDRYGARVELDYGDYANSGCRNEVARDTPITEGTEHYYAWSTKFDPSYPSSTGWQVFTQWHHSGPDGSPPLEMDVAGENLVLYTHGDQQLWHAPLVRGIWHDFVVHVFWSSDATKGFLELWYDGQKVLDKTHAQTLYPGQYVYLKQGLYREASIVPTAVLFHDGMTIGTTLADVAPQLVPGSTPDAGTPTTGGGNTADAGSGSGSGSGSAGGAGSGGGAGSVDGGAPVPATAPAGATEDGLPHGGCASRGGAGTSAFFLAAAFALLFFRRRRAQARAA